MTGVQTCALPIFVDSTSDQLGTALVPLATQHHDPLLRLQEISHSMAELNETVHPRSAEAIRAMFDAAPAIASLASRLIVRTGAFTRLMPPFNVYVVNVPGGAADSSIDGHQVVHQYPLSALVDGTGLSVGITSHGEMVDVCFVADRELVLDVDLMAEQMAIELKLLVDAAKMKAST